MKMIDDFLAKFGDLYSQFPPFAQDADLIRTIFGGVLAMWALKQTGNLIKWLLNRRLVILLEVEGSGGIRPRRGKAPVRTHPIKWFWWQLIYYTDRSASISWYRFFIHRYGFWYRLRRFVAKDFSERCKCPVPHLKLPEWISINGPYWVNDDVVSLRYSACCETCKGMVFVSRKDLLSFAKTLPYSGIA